MFELPVGTQALIFDLDGTLVDSNPLHSEAWRETYARHGIALDTNLLEQFGGMPTRTIIVELNTMLGLEFDPIAVGDQKDEASYRLMHRSIPIEPVIEIARRYRGELPMCIASGNTDKNVKRVLETHDWSDLFPVIVSANSNVRAKPFPDIFLECARCMRVDPAACHVLEDGEMGFRAARAAGMTFTDVRTLILAPA